ncbi:MAG: response regulator, partial [Thermomicrobiales bacterium]
MLGRILLVEDEESVARLVHRALSLEGYAVTVAREGRRAIEMCRAARPDLLLLDLTLPGMDGIEICRRLRASWDASAEPSTPILMLTGRDAVRDRVAGVGAGADDYLVKP